MLGTIPTEIANVKFGSVSRALAGRKPKLLLQGNQLTGTMPYLGGSLTHFDLSRNIGLSGTFPIEYGDVTRWKPSPNQEVIIDVSDTNMNGDLENVFCGDRFATLGGPEEATIIVDCTNITCSCCICNGVK